jgi:gas vesicle protein
MAESACENSRSNNAFKMENDSESNKAPLAADPTTTEELAEFVQNQLMEMQKKLQGMTEHILNRIDNLGSRINDLERNMNDLIEAAEVDTETGTPKASGDTP